MSACPGVFCSCTLHLQFACSVFADYHSTVHNNCLLTSLLICTLFSLFTYLNTANSVSIYPSAARFVFPAASRGKLTANWQKNLIKHNRVLSQSWAWDAAAFLSDQPTEKRSRSSHSCSCW